MKNIQYRLFLLVATVGILFQSCTKKEILSFSASPAVNFTTTFSDYSFMTNPQNEYIQEIEVKIIGNVADVDRKFNAVVVNDSITTATNDQYEILGGVVKANNAIGKLSVKLKNSTALSTKKVSIKLKLVDGADLKAGNKESTTFVLGWTNQILVPATWTYYNVYFATKSTKVYRLILQTTGIASLTAAEYRVLGEVAATAAGTKFGDYVKQWNLDHPDDKLKHDDGTAAGQEIVPKYYTKSKYN